MEQERQQKEPSDDSNSNEKLAAAQAKIQKLRAALQDRAIVTNASGAFTAEGRQPQKKERLMEQLRLARRLRGVMEGAADQAEAAASNGESLKDRRSIFMQHTDSIHQLVALTEAVQGRYTLDNYHQHIEWSRQQSEEETRELQQARSVIRNHVRAMSTSEPRRAPVVARRGSASSRPFRASATTRAGRRPKVSHKLQQSLAGGTATSTSSTGKTASIPPKPSDSAPVDPSLLKKAPPSAANATSVQKASSSTAKRKTPSPNYDDDDDDSPKSQGKRPSSSSSSSRPNSRPSSRLQKRRRVVQPRKCHHCKSVSSLFRPCHFWFLTGTKCGKTFCRKCLENIYLERPDPEFWDDPDANDDPNWQCPACLDTCLCKDCYKAREKMQKRLESTGGMPRKSSRHH